jgi:hypothetical protein
VGADWQRTEVSPQRAVKCFGMMVARDGVEPPTPAFSVFFEPKPFFIQQLNPSRWPIYCDHSVTSADVRLSVGRTIKPGSSSI